MMNLVDLGVIVFMVFLGFLMGTISVIFFVAMMKAEKKIVHIGLGEVKKYVAIIGLKKNLGTEIIYKDSSIDYVEFTTSKLKDFLEEEKDWR